MNIKNFMYFAFLLLLLASCKEDKTDTVTVSQENVIEGERATPVETAPASATSSSAAPEYMNIEMEGFGTPNANLRDFHGKVVFFNHWGSWCPPCRMEMPSIQALYDKYGDKVEFVMLAMEKRPGAHVPYIEKEGFTFPVYSPVSPIATEMKARAYPTTIILDKNGQVKLNDVGAKDWNSDQVHKFLDDLLAE